MIRHPKLALLALAISFSVQADPGVDKAMQALTEGNAQVAAKMLQPLADQGNPQAQLQLGMLYYNGHGVGENEKRAIELLSLSAKQGNASAMYQLGNAFTFGNLAHTLVDDPDVEAAKWYHQAATAGNADAQYSLGLLFMAGKGVVKDAKEAQYWMQLAARAGHKDAKSYVSGGR